MPRSGSRAHVAVTMYTISRLSVLFCVYTLCSPILTFCQENGPIVTVSQGSLRGVVDTLYDGTSFLSFRGIPYAQPPIGPLRFMAPRPPQPWQGTLNATAYGSVCAQTDAYDPDAVFQGSEDCLFLNVFTRALDQCKPVMIYIHGGSFFSGSGNDDAYGPKFLLQWDIVLVTINYRLEALGFLCLDTDEVPGNAGMKDQLAALKWVKANIAHFGGDPNKITIFGESSGACSVSHHIISPLSKGLFQKAILQSGSSLQDWALGVDSKNRAFRLGKYLGKYTNSTTELLKFLRGLPAVNLTRVTDATRTEDEKNRGQPEQFLPVVEKVFHNVKGFLVEKPIDSLLSKKTTKVPLLVGYNSAEAILDIQERLQKLDFYNQNPSYNVPRPIAEKVSPEKMNELGKRITNFYIGDRNFTKDDYNVIVNMLSDTDFVYDIHKFIYLYSKYSSPIYMYRFSYETDLNVFKRAHSGGLHLKGACHGDDVFYLFSNVYSEALYKSEDVLKTYVSKMTKLWTDFATTSNPTPDHSWPIYTSTKKKYLDINVNSTAGSYAERERVEFWDSLYCEVGLPCIKNN